ncbi:hypothetical protein HUU39_14970, partial [candidate division KSB1 bacterium]|nr:hypothetical protein [candidate division KSB1 bacterium]
PPIDAADGEVAMHDSPKYFLTTSRLGFRCWREDDLPLAKVFSAVIYSPIVSIVFDMLRKI